MTRVEYGDGQVIEDLEAYVAAHEKAKNDLVALRSEKKELEALASAGSEEEVTKWKDRAIKSEARLAIEATGVKDADRVLKRMNLSEVDFDDEGNLTGFNESLEEFKTDFPEIFDPKVRTGGKLDANATGVVEPKKSVSEMQAEALLNS